MCPVTRAGRTDARGASSGVSRCRTTSEEWHIMSLRTPPPWSFPNDMMCHSSLVVRHLLTPHHQRGVAHHVVEDAPALELPLPEPGHVGSAVLLRRPGEIGAARERGAARPDDGAALRHGRRERLVFEIAVGDPGLFCELEDPLRFRDVAAEWFLTRDPAELSLPARHGVRDLLEVVDAGEVRTAHPERIDRGVGH